MAIQFSYTAGDEGGAVIDPMYLKRLVIDAEAILDAAVGRPNLARMKAWFGERNFPHGAASAAYHQVTTRTEALRRCLTDPRHRVEFVSRNIDSGAHADRSDPRCRIYLANRFGMRIYSHGERLVAFFHESSHTVLHTSDVAWEAGTGAAHRAHCVALSKHPSRFPEALSNAENWGYYLVASYYTAAGLFEQAGVADWNHVKSLADIEDKPGVTAADARLTRLPEMHLPGKTWQRRAGRLEGAAAVVEIPCVEIDRHHVYQFNVDDDRVEKKILVHEKAKSLADVH
jgi:hypothetical protein